MTVGCARDTILPSNIPNSPPLANTASGCAAKRAATPMAAALGSRCGPWEEVEPCRWSGSPKVAEGRTAARGAPLGEPDGVSSAVRATLTAQSSMLEVRSARTPLYEYIRVAHKEFLGSCGYLGSEACRRYILEYSNILCGEPRVFEYNHIFCTGFARKFVYSRCFALAIGSRIELAARHARMRRVCLP